jgi:hypothetical protein
MPKNCNFRIYIMNIAEQEFTRIQHCVSISVEVAGTRIFINVFERKRMTQARGFLERGRRIVDSVCRLLVQFKHLV